MTPGPERFTVEPDGVVRRLVQGAEIATHGLAALVAQEVRGYSPVGPHVRAAELMKAFGFGFEPWSEPGHVRMQPMAARMFASAEEHARRRMLDLTTRLGLPFDEVSGVVVVDTASAGLARYLDLIHADASLYGAEPYALSGARRGMILRQTSCLQKFSIAAEWDWASTALPRCLFEISDSFRGEHDDAVEQLFRVRKFRLPEAHLHHVGLEAAFAMAREVHRFLSGVMRDLETEFVLLVSVSHDTWAKYQKVIAAMVADSATWALVLASPPGARCQDGIELDFEYKFLDARGLPRELATFQIDTHITRSVGLSARLDDLTTTHLVPTGSVERLVYAHLDRVARHEQRGRRAALPTWLAPVGTRFLEDPGAPDAGVAALAGEAAGRGLRVEIDDRPLPIAEKLVDADRLLVPFTVSSAGTEQPGRVLVRSYDDLSTRERTPSEWLATMVRPLAVFTGPLGSSMRLSLRPAQGPGHCAVVG
jgi:threonyl-tRNA synthetase